MRVTFASLFRNGVQEMARAAEALVARQREVASGRRVHAASDDPTAAVGILGERGEMRAIDQYVRATDSVQSRLQVTDSVLTDAIQVLTAAQSTAAAARSSVVTPEQRLAFAQQLRGLRDTLLADVNTRFRGHYIFSGAKTATAPFTKDANGVVQAYAGDANEVQLDIDRSRAVAVTMDGDRLARGVEAQDVFAVLEALATAAESGDQPGLAQGMEALDRAFDRFTNAQSRVGVALGALDNHRVRLGDLRRASDGRRAALEDANLAEAIAAMQQADTAHRAAVGAVANTTKVSLFDFLR